MSGYDLDNFFFIKLLHRDLIEIINAAYTDEFYNGGDGLEVLYFCCHAVTTQCAY
jgi:hypothetical protein